MQQARLKQIHKKTAEELGDKKEEKQEIHLSCGLVLFIGINPTADVNDVLSFGGHTTNLCPFFLLQGNAAATLFLRCVLQKSAV